MSVRLLLLVTFAALGFGSAQAQTNFPDVSSLGRLFIASLTNAPFPQASRTNGHAYQGVTFPSGKHYADSSTAFFIPKGFNPGAEIDVVIHFHGWRNSIAGAARDFDLIGQFAASGRNAVLILPEGPVNAPDSSGGKLEDAGGFKRFMDEAMSVLRSRASLGEAKPGKVVLSGHSGAYRVISAIIDVGGWESGINEVYLFDALYGQSDRFQRWIEGGPARRLVVLYADSGGTLAETKKFIGTMSDRGVPSFNGEEASATDAQLRGSRLVFLHSAQGHNEVLSKGGNFRRFLETSSLKPIPLSR